MASQHPLNHPSRVIPEATPGGLKAHTTSLPGGKTLKLTEVALPFRLHPSTTPRSFPAPSSLHAGLSLSLCRLFYLAGMGRLGYVVKVGCFLPGSWQWGLLGHQRSFLASASACTGSVILEPSREEAEVWLESGCCH